MYLYLPLLKREIGKILKTILAAAQSAASFAASRLSHCSLSHSWSKGQGTRSRFTVLYQIAWRATAKKGIQSIQNGARFSFGWVILL